MKIIGYFALLLASLTFCSCARYYQLTDPNYSVAIEKSKPKHEGAAQSGRYGPYDYLAYKRSVSLKATTGVMRVYRAEVFDTNQNGTFDTVFALIDGKWNYGATREVRREYRMIDSGLSTDLMMDYIDIATKVKRSIVSKKTIQQVVPKKAKAVPRATAIKKAKPIDRPFKKPRFELIPSS